MYRFILGLFSVLAVIPTQALAGTQLSCVGKSIIYKVWEPTNVKPTSDDSKGWKTVKTSVGTMPLYTAIVDISESWAARDFSTLIRFSPSDNPSYSEVYWDQYKVDVSMERAGAVPRSLSQSADSAVVKCSGVYDRTCVADKVFQVKGDNIHLGRVTSQIRSGYSIRPAIRLNKILIAKDADGRFTLEDAQFACSEN